MAGSVQATWRASANTDSGAARVTIDSSRRWRSRAFTAHASAPARARALRLQDLAAADDAATTSARRRDAARPRSRGTTAAGDRYRRGPGLLHVARHHTHRHPSYDRRRTTRKRRRPTRVTRLGRPLMKVMPPRSRAGECDVQVARRAHRPVVPSVRPGPARATALAVDGDRQQRRARAPRVARGARARESLRSVELRSSFPSTDRGRRCTDATTKRRGTPGFAGKKGMRPASRSVVRTTERRLTLNRPARFAR